MWKRCLIAVLAAVHFAAGRVVADASMAHSITPHRDYRMKAPNQVHCLTTLFAHAEWLLSILNSTERIAQAATPTHDTPALFPLSLSRLSRAHASPLCSWHDTKPEVHIRLQPNQKIPVVAFLELTSHSDANPVTHLHGSIDGNCVIKLEHEPSRLYVRNSDLFQVPSAEVVKWDLDDSAWVLGDGMKSLVLDVLDSFPVELFTTMSCVVNGTNLATRQVPVGGVVSVATVRQVLARPFFGLAPGIARTFMTAAFHVDAFPENATSLSVLL